MPESSRFFESVMDAWAAMTHRRIVSLATAIVALATAASFMGGCGGEQKAAAGPPNVEIATVVQKDVPIVREFVSTLTGLVNAQIRAQVSGYLVKQLYINGAYVKKGTPLFQLDDRTFRAAVDQASGNLAQAKADLQKAQAQLGKTQLDVDRYTPLAKTGAISQQELDDAVQANLAAKGQVAAAKASIDAGTAALESAKLNLGFATVVAPIDGVAGISNVDPILANITPSEEDYLNAMKAAQKSGMTDIQILSPLVWELELTNGAIYGEKGRFYAMDRQVNIQTGTILLQIKFPNPGRILRPGGFGNVRTVARLEKNALLVPQRAVTDIQGKYLIAVVGEDNKVSIRPVTAGDKVGTMWVITGGLHPGDRVVAEGTQKVQEGLLVNPKPFQEPAVANSTKGGLQ